jgi:spermidine synthase
MQRRARAVFSILFFLSGLAGLVYEVCWTRLLVLPMGNTVYSLTAVLTAFMGGLALGAFLAGRWIDQRGRPLRVYAWLEAGIGGFCFVLPWIVQAEQPLFRWVYRSIDASFLAFHLFKFLACGAVILVPATLMGATLPVLCRSFLDAEGRLGRALGWLYAVNAFGAVAGSLLSGFVLIPQLGLRGAMHAGVAISLGVAVIAWLAQARLPAQRTLPKPGGSASAGAGAAGAPARDRAPIEIRSRADEVVLLAGYGISGMAAMLFQIAWARVLALVIGSSVYAFALLVSAFILGLALGSSAASRFADRLRHPARAFALAELGIGLSALAMVPVFQRFPDWMLALVPQLSQSFGRLQLVQFGLVFLVLLLPTAGMGMCLPFVGRAVLRDVAHAGRAVGTAYSANTVGTILGAFLGGFLFLPVLGMQRTLLTGAGLNFLVAVALLGRVLPRRWALPGAAAVAVAGVLALLLVPRFDPATLTSGAFLYADRYRNIDATQDLAHLMRQEYSILLYEEGLGSTITVKESSDGTRLLAVNGKVDASDDQDMATQALLGHIPALLHHEPRDAAVIGLASGVTVHALAVHPSVRAIDCIEISPEMARAARFFDHVNGRVLDDPRVRLVVQDGRNHLTLTGRTYDVIVSEPSNPWMAGIAALYTREFFSACRDRLAPGGMAAVFLHLYSMDLPTFRNLIRTFQSVFPHTSLWETGFGLDYLLAGARDSIDVDWEHLAGRMQAPAVATDLEQIGIRGPAGLLVRQLGDAAALREFAGAGPLYTDDRNRLEFDAPRLLYRPMEIGDLQGLERLRRPGLPSWLHPPPGGLPPADADAIASVQAARNEFFRGVVFHALERGDDALQSFLRALERDPHTPGLRENLLETALQFGVAAHASGDTAAAVSLWRRIVALEPECAEYQNALGVELSGAGHLAEAEACYRKAVALQPRDTNLRTNLARALALQVKYAEAETTLRELLDLHPNNAPARVFLATLQLRAGDLEAAEGLCLEATRLNPGAADSWLLLGEVLLRQAAYRPAIRALETALARGAPTDRARPLLAECYTHLGEKRKAESALGGAAGGR